MSRPAAIAIIGIGLRLPGADTLDGFWRHLAEARSLIGEVPRQRWDKDEWRGNPARDNKTNCIWGGFVDDADCFDADFFGISPREAAWMDPQQRFALEMAWHAIEDAGYAASALAGSRTGVFMGVCHWDYAELLEKHLAQVDAYTPTGIAFSIIANRVSHFFDLHGPSVTNDTACAASATAVHDAVRAIQSGACDMALAGGVNLIWSPNHFVAFAKAGMLSKNGRAKAFDAAADGYVRGEGGAVLLLKPLERALADGDPIHGVIQGVGVNHGGRTNSLTVTNPRAQAALIAQTHQAAGIAPDTVSYIEAHGPGTPLGDPIEIAGLKQAFAQLHEQAGTTPRAGSCGIGSVKTNIGHLEGAAGVAGMVKVLAALRHGVLPANVGFERLNDLIDLGGTPFRIQAEVTPWPRDPARPRRAAVSSFGFGGSNAHVVIEEAPAPAPTASLPGPHVLPLSARDEAGLTALVEAVRAFVAERPADIGLDQLAYTLQTGREAQEHRAAFEASDWDDLAAALAENRILRPGAEGDDLATAWVNGGAVDWSVLWPTRPRRIHAPLTRFNRIRHWMDESVAAKDDHAVPHPLLHRNLSGFGGVRYRTRLKGPEFFWADHHVGGAQVLPGVVALEMARAAAEHAGGAVPPLALDNVVWARPIRAGDGPTTIEVRLDRRADGAVAFTIAETNTSGPAHCQGTVQPLDAAPRQLDLTAPGEAMAVAECYARLRASGVDHGPAFQALSKVHGGGGEVLAQLKLPRRLLPSLSALALHPVLLDAAIQAWVGLDGDGMAGAAVPFACRRVEVFGPCEPVMWARVRPAEAPATAGLMRLDIDLADKTGAVRVAFRDLSLRVMTATATPEVEAEAEPPLLTMGTWRPAALDAPRREPADGLVVLAGLKARMNGAVLRLPSPGTDLAATVQSWFAALHGRLAQVMREAPRAQVLVLADDALPPALIQPLAALLKTATIEQPKLDAAIIRVAGPADSRRLAAIVAAERSRADSWPELRYDESDRRHAWMPEETALPAAAPLLDPDATYWVTGGLGGLGRIFAGWLVERGARHVVLSGRSAVAADDPRLTALGPHVRYATCDMADGVAVAQLAASLAPLKGVIHAAGVLDDGYILTRDAARDAAVLAPKVAGTIALDAATRDAPLDFMVLCSSVAAVFGNAGQGGYGAANAFLDGFAEQRNALVAQGLRHGATSAIAWPLWAEGGMRVDDATRAALTRRFGTEPMPTAAGLAALDRIVAAGASRVTVLHGDRDRLHRMLAHIGHAAAPEAPVAATDDAPQVAQVQDFVRDILADVLRLEPGQIRANRKLDEYGLDSIAIVEATNRLEEALGPLSKTLFFEYVDLAGIAAHLAAEHGAALARALGPTAPAAAATAQPARVAAEIKRADPADDRDSHDVAIVGLSLRVSKAADQDAFWRMLSQGLHGFEPYPAERWDHAAILHPERDVLGKTVVKTGAFLDDIAAFDPRYFRISQYEAELMSPEVRLFLQASVEAFEDAGYSRETLQTRYDGDVAVIMGSMTNEYDLYGFQNMLMRGSLASGSYTGTVPNMVSYFYGFTGPSYFLDTMCSASSTCVHEAVHMLRAGRCAMALAGGVSLLLHPQKLIATSQEHFTTKTAEVIRGYGLGADGTILGEGVGALVLKRLGDARRDGDHIYGVIRGTAISNAGIRNGFTVPNPHQQAAAIEQALDDAGVSAGTITYVEGHGSGTALGDPIEVRALTQAWRKHTDAVQVCPLGTVKSNVAHLLAASGLAGIAKVLMQMKHGQLAPSLHAETLNPNIAFEKTPFFVQRELAPWRRLIDESGAEIPRRAGITSIGAGGMNSHIIVEEYQAPPAAPAPAGPQLLVFSALSETSLTKVVERFIAHLEHHPEQALADLAYTLQVGRNQLPCRLALIAADRADAAERLRAFVAAPGAGAGLWYCRSILDRDPEPVTNSHDSAAVAVAWISGAPVEWDDLHGDYQPRRLSLPAYPFERVHCWYPNQPDAPSVVHPLGSKLKLHPFVGRNCSDLAGLRYATDLHLGELLDYVFKRDRVATVLPPVVAEIAAAVGRIAGLDGPLCVGGLSVTNAVDWPQATELTASLDPSLHLHLAVDGKTWAEATLTQGGTLSPPPAFANGERLEAAALYGALRQRGYDFTPYLDVVEHAERLPGGAVRCVLRAEPPQQDRFKSRMQIPAPALAAAFQALLLAAPGEDGAGLSSLDRMVVGTAGAIAQVVAQPRGDGGYALWFLGADGQTLAHMDGLRLAPAETVAGPASIAETSADDPQTRLAHDLRAIAAELLKFSPEQVGLRDAFHDLGFDSISLARLADAISTAYGITLSPAVFFEVEHLQALSAHLIARHAVAPATPRAPQAAQPARIAQSIVRAAAPRPTSDAIAIIGMAGRFPGAGDVDTLFDRLLAGDDLTGPGREGTWRGGFLAEVDRFDAALFRISPVEAERMDPQQRLMLETAWRALEHAGYGADELPPDTAVMVGASALDYAALLRRAGIAADGYGATGNSLAMIANRVSYFFNLHGPSETVDTACSSSLVALLRAAEALKRGVCSAALVGGVNLMLAPEGFEGPAQAGMLSADGRCKSFGAAADGYGRGEGVVMVLLKRLADAERDGDRILGTLIGGAENHGGRAGSLTAPSVAAQAELIQAAMAGIDPRSISHIEAHGTGTALGDPVELNGLRRAYGALMGTENVAAPFIALGSVKASIGHLEAAAGLAGLVKVLQSMARGVLPASLHCTPPNPHLDLAGSPFRLLTNAQPWPAGETPRRAGISSFGFGGTNAHVVVEDYRPATAPRRQPLPPRAFADTRFWLPGADATIVVTPTWVEAAAVAGRKVARRVVVAAETLPPAYEDAAQALLDVLRGQRGDVLVQLALPVGDLRAGLGGMLDSAALERPGLEGQVVEVEPGLSADALAADAADPASRIRYQSGRRFVRGWSDLPDGEALPWRPRGVFLITGGTGGLGRLLARDIARNAPGAVLVLTGTRPEDAERAAFVAELRGLGAVAAYRQVDCADAPAVAALVRGIVEVHGALTMVLHCAGTLRDGLMRGKSATDLAAVLAPKVAGSRALVAACAGLELDALVLFSSLAGAVGNVGQSDYAAANGFMDALAESSGLPLVAIDWPLWAEGGMRANAIVRDALFARMGQRPLSTADGLAALRRILSAKVSRAAVVAGDAARIRAFFTSPEATPVATVADDDRLAAAVTARLRNLFAEAGGFAVSAIHTTTPLEEYGIDSLMITRLNAALGDGLGALPKTLFFQYRTLAEVAGALTRDHAEACRRWTDLAAAPAAVPAAPMVATRTPPTTAADPIAIIGIAGRYPGADDLDGFWDNLAAGRDAVGEVPAERWSLDGFFHPDRDEAIERGLSYAKWGAFLDGFADFDPLFFKISPRDAAAMDPQERLFLMCAWAAAEDAGYSPARLGAANPVGVFVGVTKTGFALHGPFAAEGGAVVRPNTCFASIANRVSHALNLTGPSLPLDTMCSSSATALHEACEHLRSGAAGMALAGGVNLYLHPSTFVDLSAARMLSPDGVCRSFGKGANGFVPGEGVGCVVLKPLSRALADGDRIHAVIRASAINHGGHTNGYTVPNPAAQRDLVRLALDHAGLSAESVTCIEAHGTGTELGDPIEVEGLTQAFAADTSARGFCALGSIKSNIGHLEAAAGIAGLTKVVLALRHRALPPTLHADEVNPNLDLARTPFTLPRRLSPWTPSGKRIAGISSFGAGGANAHVIVEEAPPAAATTIPGPQAIVLSARDADGLRRQAERLLRVVAAPAAPIGLGGDLRAELARLLDVAATELDGAEPFDSLGLDPAQRLALRGWVEQRLGRAVDAVAFAHLTCLDQIVAHVGGAADAAPSLADLAFTLQVGREAMEYRLALVADDLPAVAEGLRRWLAGDDGVVLCGQSGQHHDILDDTAALADLAARWWEQGELTKLLSLWAKGLAVDWASLPRRQRPAIVSLPTYPFACRRFWLPTAAQPSAPITAPQGDAGLQAEAERLDRAIAAILAATLRDTPVPIPALTRWRTAAQDLLAATDVAPGDPWAAWENLRRSGGPAAQMALAEATLRALPDILAGKRPATSVMFPDGALGLVEATYKDNPVAARFSRTLAQAAAAFVAASPLPALRILEIGAGTGGTSERVFEALAPQSGRVAEYRYTDLSRAFLIHAERTYGPRWPQLTTALFDVEKPPAGQDVVAGGYDIVIAANVLHATADMARTLDHVRALLAPGGVLLINETSRATLFTHVTFGLLEGWWRFTDPARRIPGTPSLTPQSWQTLLAEAGLEWLAGSLAAECALGQQIIAARAPGVATAHAPAPARIAPAAPVPAAPTGESLRDRLLAVLGETLNVAPTTILPDRSFADYGLDSILGAELVHKLRRALGVELDHTALFDHTNVVQLEAFLARQVPAPVVAAPAIVHAPAERQPIAIIGYSGRFAKSPDAEALWTHLMAGDDLVEPVSRFDLAPLYRDAAPGTYGRHGSFIDGIENFDPVFFGISGLEATYMDPQQRLFLEEAWKTLDHAGHAGDAIHGRRIGVFAGCSSGDYHDLFHGQKAPGQAFWGNTSSLIPGRIAYFLDLKGPAVAVDTACSSSLVAVHLACQSLWSGESEMALAGGVFVQCTPRFYRSANQANMLSPSGRCAAFGAGADGIVPGEAVGAVLLRPLAEALADGDTIHGIIVASGLNQDGTTNGITAPSAASQERLIRSVYAQFDIDPASIGLVEAHGTGTPLGDPIEHAALARAFGPGAPGSVALGSVKSNIGHATTAAGIAGLIKVLLSLRHGAIPPTLHFNGGNPAIRFADGPFAVNTAPLPWTEHRRAAISSFGFSGTNALVVVDAPPAQPATPPSPGPHLFVLSARTPELLRAQAEDLAAHLEHQPDLSAADVAYTLATGRRHLRHRLALEAESLADVVGRLRRWLIGDAACGVLSGEAADNAPDTTGDAAAFVAGARPTAPAQARRVPLPVTRFAAIRCWVQAAPPSPPPQAQPVVKALPLRLADPATLAGPFPAAVPTRVTLAPLSPAPATGNVERLADADGVRRLRVSGDGAGLAGELAAAANDETVRVVLLEGEIRLTDELLDCPLPVVAATAAADFQAQGPEAAALARQVAEAPHLALVELKHAMRRAAIPEAATVWPLAEAVAPGPATVVPLTTACMSLEAFADGVVLLRMSERQHKNSFTDIFMDGLAEAFAAIARLDGAKVVVLTGFDGYFACGGTRDGLEQLQQGATRFTDRTIYSLPLECPLPVIAAMQGHAIGAGWSLGMFCDLQVFAAEAVYHSNYLWYGFTPGAGATLVFPHRLGDRLGREVLFTAHEYRGRELAARRPDLRVTAAAQVLPSALALAHGLARQSREYLLALKAEAARPLRERLPATFARELAMHEKTFIGNPRVQERIERMFPAAAQPAAPAPASASSRDAVRSQVVATLAEDLMIPAADIRDGAGFLELGLDSILAVTWIRRLNALLGAELPATAVYAHPTVGALVDHLAAKVPEPTAAPVAAPAPAAPSGRDAVRTQVVATLAEDLMIPAADIRDGAGFLELGLDSILAVTWIRRLNTLLGVELPATAVYAHPTVGALIDHLTTKVPAPPAKAEPAPVPAPVAPPAVRRKRTDRSAADAVAIIGASGRFPKAPDLDAFWDNIRTGRDCIEEVPPDRWDIARFYHPDPMHPGTSSCKWMGAIDDVDRFDAAFFNITPREAELMDPQQRLFLQHAWQAFEDAGLDPSALGGTSCGVFVGAGPSGYGNLIDEHNAYSLLGCSGSILAARIAHLLDLRGPCISLDTACSSSLVAIAEACNSLLVGDSDLALAGGVQVMIGPEMFIDTSKVNMLSVDGRCFTFDSRANGFVPGEGAGVLLLKRLEDAERDGDPIHAVIRGWGLNQDGRTNGITAPNPQAQTRLIRDVQQRFGIAPASIGMIECHGTGTPLGDPIEIEGLTDAFAGSGGHPGSCALGSVKSNVGHLLAAAGVAGAIKAMQAVERAELPPTINFERMNEHISLTGTPFMVNTALRPWPATNGPRRAAISAFGFSGTNAHVVMDSAPAAAAGGVPGPWVFTLSARNRDRLAHNAAALERFVAGHPGLDLGDVAHTLHVGRKTLGARAAFVCTDRDGLLRVLASLAAGQPLEGVHLSTAEPQAGAPLSPRAQTPAQLAEAWANGAHIDWAAGPVGRRLHLPGTVFARDRHWVEVKPATPEPASAPDILPALMLPELARSAAERDAGLPVRALRHLVWGRPPADGAQHLDTVIDADDQGRLFRIVADGAEWAPCAVGEIADSVPPAPATVTAPAQPGDIDVTESFRRAAPACGAVRAVWRRGDEVLARVVLPAAPTGFDPAALDLAWRLAAFRTGAEPLHPQAAESMALYGAMPAEFLVRVWLRPGAAHPSIALLDQQGVPRLCLDGLRTAPYPALADILLGEHTAS
ncbi:MAG: SDR family NAD(P)-dependent oxidoreductase [Bacteroidota bacterium]